MDMSGNKANKPVWIFPDTEGLPVQGTFLDCKNEVSKGAVEYPVITLESTGMILKISKWKCNVDDCVRALGKDSDAWKGKLVEVNKDKNNKLYLKVCETQLIR